MTFIECASIVAAGTVKKPREPHCLQSTFKIYLRPKLNESFMEKAHFIRPR